MDRVLQLLRKRMRPVRSIEYAQLFKFSLSLDLESSMWILLAEPFYLLLVERIFIRLFTTIGPIYFDPFIFLRQTKNRVGMYNFYSAHKSLIHIST